MALTGTPLINDIEDFRAIWQFLGWIDDTKPLAELMQALEETGLTPADPGTYPAARQCVVDRWIVRRRKVDVAADIPPGGSPTFPSSWTRRSADRSGRPSGRSPVGWWRSTRAHSRRKCGPAVEGIDHDLVRRIATRERKEATTAGGEENVFAMMRRIGRAKAGLAADYPAQLARSAGQVVFFAKHVDVMDAAEAAFRRPGSDSPRSVVIRRGRRGRSRSTRSWKDPDVMIAVCSLTAAGVGINLQVASNIVLAELSWTDAEQTQAIDRGHRIGRGRARHRMAHHCRPDDRREDRRAHRQQGGARHERWTDRRTRCRPPPTCNSRPWWPC